ncbi:polysaccharide deacetylase family protein [Clostridium sp. CF011]|uniref:polysaccharide deacetylase family protein n=1 Tax=Clostridium sp. CF011 TaxID=2843318 RepID=UPI001C0C2E6A|nr:polysaccharide deacetylase family protein [Clostridium sp. CF011]MBU3092278.1 polysaccharide deacetylase family protein [Clostridium sp. CF011]WAG70256.1 polysaccharide deacetylase family protein [Clostridium sp. CF011]
MKKLFNVFGLLVLLIGSVFITYKIHAPIKITETQSSVDKTTDKENIIQPTASELTLPQTSSDTATKKAQVIYDILGTSSRPTIYPDAAMTKWRKNVVNLAKKYPSDLYINGQNVNKVVALTFDDGPDPINTPKIIKVLRENNIQGTFFCIGKQIEACKSIIKEAYEDGNVISNHSWAHKDFATINASEIRNEVTLTENEINKVIGKTPALIRVPYGDTNDAVQNSLTTLNYKNIIWSTDTLDWEQREVDNIVKNSVENVRPGEIILMHCNEDKKVTTEALPQIISKLKEMGYSFVTVDKLLEISAYK